VERLGFRTTIVMGVGNLEKKAEQLLPGIDSLADADLVNFFVRCLRRRAWKLGAPTLA